MKTAYTTPEMKIDLLKVENFLVYASPTPTSPSTSTSPNPNADPSVWGPEMGIFDESFAGGDAGAPFAEVTPAPAADPGIDLGVPQIGVPVFTLDPVGEITDPVSDVISGGDTGVSE